MHRRVIAVDIDNTLNTFTQTLRETDFPYDPIYALPEERYRTYLAKIKSDGVEEGELLSTEYSYLRARIHQRCYAIGQPKPGAAAFMQWLRRDGWRIVICTYRDLRRSNEVTRQWLGANEIPFDELFMASNKVVFCKAWGIPILIDDDPLNSTHGGTHGILVYYPLDEKARGDPHATAKGFDSFDQVKQWLQQ